MRSTSGRAAETARGSVLRLGVATIIVISALAGAPAVAAGRDCGQVVHLRVEPAEKAAEVAAVIARRLRAAGGDPAVAAEGPGALRATLPAGAAQSLLTRPARIEFRLVADKPDAPGAITLPRADGKGSEQVEPQVILNENHLREIEVRQEPNGAGGATTVALTFHFDPIAMKNLLRRPPRRSGASSPSWLTTGSSSTRSSAPRSPRRPARFPAASPWRRRTSSPSSCATAGCRRASASPRASRRPARRRRPINQTRRAKRGAQTEAARRRRRQRQRAAIGRDALAHADKPAPRGFAGIEAAAVVGDRQRQPVAFARQRDARRVGLGVARRIGRAPPARCDRAPPPAPAAGRAAPPLRQTPGNSAGCARRSGRAMRAPRRAPAPPAPPAAAGRAGAGWSSATRRSSRSARRSPRRPAPRPRARPRRPGRARRTDKGRSRRAARGDLLALFVLDRDEAGAQWPVLRFGGGERFPERVEAGHSGANSGGRLSARGARHSRAGRAQRARR